jgi:beta-N-acetylhexosaminidase
MQIIKRIGVILIWFAGMAFVFASANKNDPYLISLRGPGNILLFVASIVVVIAMIRCGYWRGRLPRASSIPRRRMIARRG